MDDQSKPRVCGRSETAIFFCYLPRSLLESPQDDYHTQPSLRMPGRGQPTSREPNLAAWKSARRIQLLHKEQRPYCI